MIVSDNLKIKKTQEMWSMHAPREEIMPLFEFGDGITVKGNGHGSVYGWIQRSIPVTGGKTYKFTVKYRCNSREADPNLFVVCYLKWSSPDISGQNCPIDGICSYTYEDNCIRGDLTCKARKDITEVTFMLGIRYAGDIDITFIYAGFEEAAPVLPRKVKVSATRYNAAATDSAEQNKADVEELVAKAAGEGSDIIVLPEFVCWYSSKLEIPSIAESVPDGSYCIFLSDLSKKYNINLCAGIVERIKESTFNTAVLFNRSGGYVGKYQKTHLYFPEGLFQGTCPGDEYPVFDLDFGRVGIIICYDFWYAETARIMGLKGADILLFPNAGHEEKLLPARAIDNCLNIVCSTLGSPASITDTLGNVLAVIDMSNDKAVVTAELDLTQRRIPHPNAGGNENPGGAGRRCARNSVSDRLYREILTEINTYIDRNEPYWWLNYNI